MSQEMINQSEQKLKDKALETLQVRFNNIVFELNTELIEAQERLIELEGRLRIAEFKDSALGECGICGEYKHRPWKDDKHGYICAGCLGNLLNETEQKYKVLCQRLEVKGVVKA